LNRILTPHNFSAGPGELPPGVLETASRAILNVPEAGLPLLGISHRSRWFKEVVEEAEALVRELLGLPNDYHVLFMQGGATFQFSTVAATFLRGRPRFADYLETGYWSRKCLPEARKEGDIRVLWSGEECGYSRLPSDDELVLSPDAAYFHYISNETVEGLQFHRPLGLDGVRLVCDMSSDFLSRPMDVERFDIVYAHAQKNLGPAGVTVVIVRDEVLREIPEGLPAMMDYRPHVAMHSIFNTPPTFAIYVVLLVLRWLRDEVGGLEAMNRINEKKAGRLYETLDAHADFYLGRARVEDRSLMNVAFNLPNVDLERRFLAEAEEAGLVGLEGHRSCGGLRASLYNAVSLESVHALCEFMAEFHARYSPNVREAVC
jgi:phosphoserine aminotransferase